ncbi:MAG: dihydroxyacetone kinase subunit DhaK, partial [Eubacteriales bacterium]|nr:dihydroxyacetone kinase subunit DhaK [Eubacteriales bacterium]
AAHSDIIRLVPGTHMVERVTPKAKGKVRFLMGNGAGHEPAVICWVGEGMFDMNIPGEIFTCASAAYIHEGIRRLSEGGPVLVAIQNHAGDVLNANMAIDQALDEGIDVHSVVFYDDIASAPRECMEERRGIGGMLFYAKIVGAMAERGDGIDALISMFEKVRDATRTYAVAITNGTNPITGLDMFGELPPR